MAWSRVIVVQKLLRNGLIKENSVEKTFKCFDFNALCQNKVEVVIKTEFVHVHC